MEMYINSNFSELTETESLSVDGGTGKIADFIIGYVGGKILDAIWDNRSYILENMKPNETTRSSAYFKTFSK